jgi:hypothetical protein
MQPAIQSTTARTFHQVKAHHFIAGGIAFALAVLISAGALQLSSGGGGNPAQRPAVAAAQPSSMAVPESPTYYLVSSQAQADFALSAIVAQKGDEARSKVSFVVVNDVDEVNQTVQLVAHENDILYAAG